MKAKLITAIFAVVTLIGCKKDDDTPAKVYAEENPLGAYLQNSGFNQKTTNIAAGYVSEFGYTFKPKVKGKINAFTFKIPYNMTNARVTIWNADSKTVLRTIIVPNVIANAEIRQNIDALTLDTSSKYTITTNGKFYYERTKTDGSVTVYPIDAGNISILGYGYTNTAAQTFPIFTSTSYYGGDLSIVFQQTE